MDAFVSEWASALRIAGGSLLALAVLGFFAVRQADRAEAKQQEIDRLARDNDLAVRRRYNAEQQRLAKLRDAIHRGIGA